MRLNVGNDTLTRLLSSLGGIETRHNYVTELHIVQFTQ